MAEISAVKKTIMEIKGILKKVSDIIERGQNGQYTSRKIWLTTDPETQYPQTVEFEVSGNNINIFTPISIGTEVTCQFNLRGKEWTKDGKTSVFNTLQIWKVLVDGKAVDAGGYYPVQAGDNTNASTKQHTLANAESINNADDDLPF